MTYERSEHPLKSIFPETKLSGYLTNSDPSVRLAPQGPLITPQAPISRASLADSVNDLRQSYWRNPDLR